MTTTRRLEVSTTFNDYDPAFVVLYPTGRQYTRYEGRVWLFRALSALRIAAEIDGTIIQHHSHERKVTAS